MVSFFPSNLIFVVSIGDSSSEEDQANQEKQKQKEKEVPKAQKGFFYKFLLIFCS